jgi:hypothetical protein
MVRFRSTLQPVDLVLLLGSFVAIRALLSHGLEPLGAFDEGLLFANAQLMQDGRVPYRDFYTNYPPGIFQLVRAVLAWSNSPIWTMRWATFAAHLATAWCVGLLAGRSRARNWSLAASLCVLVLQADIGLVAYAYTYAVLLVLVIVLLWPATGCQTVRTVVCALLFGALSYLRHDMFLYMTLTLSLVEAAWWVCYRRSLLFAAARQLKLFSVFVTATALCLWLPIIARAGFYRVTHDLYFDMRDVMAARVLPIPPMFVMGTIPALSLQVPAILVDATRFALALSAVCIPAATFAVWKRLRASGWVSAQARIAVLCIACALATLPQAFGRTDYHHVAFGVPLVLVAGFRALGANTARVLSLFSLLLLFAAPKPLISGDDFVRFWRTDDASFVSSERKILVDYILRETKADDALFIGCTAHRRAIMSVIDLHYLAHRSNATRYVQFDPGLVTKPDKQHEMIADLERSQPPVILRYAFCSWDEPNDSRLEGAGLLDDYLEQEYRRDRRVSSFDVWRRVSTRR